MNFNTATRLSMTQQQKLLSVEPPENSSVLGKKCLVERPPKRCIFSQSNERQARSCNTVLQKEISKKHSQTAEETLLLWNTRGACGTRKSAPCCPWNGTEMQGLSGSGVGEQPSEGRREECVICAKWCLA